MSTKARAVPLKREPAGFSRGVWEMERCCFCRQRTPFWTAMKDRVPGEQVACCETCAAVKMPTQMARDEDARQVERELEESWRREQAAKDEDARDAEYRAGLDAFESRFA